MPEYSTLSHEALVEQCQLKDKQLTELMIEYHNVVSELDSIKAQAAKVVQLPLIDANVTEAS